MPVKYQHEISKKGTEPDISTYRFERVGAKLCIVHTPLMIEKVDSDSSFYLRSTLGKDFEIYSRYLFVFRLARRQL